MSDAILDAGKPLPLERESRSEAHGAACADDGSAFAKTDQAHLVYLALGGVVIFLCRGNLPGWPVFLLLHGAGMAGITLLGSISSRTPARWGVGFVRSWYHLPVFLFLFEEVHWTVRILRPEWVDQGLLRVELALFGVHPTVWLEKFASHPLTEYMNFAYFSYFLLIPAGAAALMLAGRKELVPRLMFACAVGYYICYGLFHLLPIEGPYHTLGHLQQVELAGGPFTRLMNWLEGFGRIHGGAFPSAHVTAATVVLIFAWRHARRSVWLLAPLIVSLYISTVYLRYHYASDVFGGIVVGSLAYAIGSGRVNSGLQGILTRLRRPAPGRPAATAETDGLLYHGRVTARLCVFSRIPKMRFGWSASTKAPQFRKRNDLPPEQKQEAQ